MQLIIAGQACLCGQDFCGKCCARGSTGKSSFCMLNSVPLCSRLEYRSLPAKPRQVSAADKNAAYVHRHCARQRKKSLVLHAELGPLVQQARVQVSPCNTQACQCS